jgi:hypothetical protein
VVVEANLHAGTTDASTMAQEHERRVNALEVNSLGARFVSGGRDRGRIACGRSGRGDGESGICAMCGREAKGACVECRCAVCQECAEAAKAVTSMDAYFVWRLKQCRRRTDGYHVNTELQYHVSTWIVIVTLSRFRGS